jgi:hypothetical protein
MSPLLRLSGILLLAWAVSQPAGLQLPGDDFQPGWMAPARPLSFIKADLFNHIDGGAEIFLELGFRSVDIQRYRRGDDELELEVYEMESPEAALGIYLMNCGREEGFADIPARNSSELSQATILKGRYFLHVNNSPGRKETRPAMVALARAMLDKIPVAQPRPILDLLPREGRIAGSERLIRGPVGLQTFYTFGEGDILQLGGRIFGVLARYENPDRSGYFRLIVPYPDEQAAARAFENLRANLDPYLKITRSESGSFAFVDFQKKTGRAELRKNVVEIRFAETAALIPDPN